MVMVNELNRPEEHNLDSDLSQLLIETRCSLQRQVQRSSIAIAQCPADRRVHLEPCEVECPEERLGPSARGKAFLSALPAAGLRRLPVEWETTSWSPKPGRHCV